MLGVREVRDRGVEGRGGERAVDGVERAKSVRGRKMCILTCLVGVEGC